MRALLFVPLAPLVFACAPVDEGEEGEGEGEEDVCEFGDVHVGSAGFVVDECLDGVVVAGSELHLTAASFDLRLSPFGAELSAPATLDENNSSCFAFVEHEGARWSIATGAIGGSPVGDCTVRLVERDDDVGLHGDGDGIAIPDGEPLGDGVFLDFRF